MEEFCVHIAVSSHNWTETESNSLDTQKRYYSGRLETSSG